MILKLDYGAKESVLQRKSYSFGMQNNRFCNILTVRMLSNIDILMRNVHTSILLFSAYEARNGRVGEEFLSVR